ncbi:hypothetical protein ZOSMA_18G01350 [Zostera marina]|uniref:Uncharacterized protein n=1 Tax=Zostera marina TaxID=29655 RepID=A0A0K9PS21_ZOSMR|nr:hypothetical protein ZOSMA_18G01350 [Zostera marina]
MDLFYVPCSSSNTHGGTIESIRTVDNNSHTTPIYDKSITLFGHRIATDVSIAKGSCHLDIDSKISRKRKHVCSNEFDTDNIEDSIVDEDHQPIISLPSTSKKRPRLQRKNSLSFEERCFYLKQIPQRLFPSSYVRGAKNSH